MLEVLQEKSVRIAEAAAAAIGRLMPPRDQGVGHKDHPDKPNNRNSGSSNRQDHGGYDPVDRSLLIGGFLGTLGAAVGLGLLGLPAVQDQGEACAEVQTIQ